MHTWSAKHRIQGLHDIFAPNFDALRAHPEVDLRFVRQGEPIPPADLIVLPGSKNTRADLAWLRQAGWPDAIARHLRYGGKVIGICGGFQMLGQAVDDPHGVEGVPGSSEGLGWLAMRTEMGFDKRLSQVSGTCAFADAPVEGYEIHMGESRGDALLSPAFYIDGRAEGARSNDGQVLGTYLHGLFDAPGANRALLRWAGHQSDTAVDSAALREASLERIADAAEPLFDALLRLPR
jgi:adenosylcobyric acid synthase